MPRATPFVISPAADLLEQHPHLKTQAGRLAQAYEKHEIVEEQHLQAVGAALWEALQIDDALEKARQAAGQQPLPIIIESDNGAILNLPWETLYHPDYEFLGRSSGFTLSRRKPGSSTVLPEPEQTPLRILLFTSLPDDLSELERLDVEAEQAGVQEALMEQERKGEIILEMPDDGCFETFRLTLLGFRPHLVYLSGHGIFTHEHHNSRAWGSFLFEDEWGNKKLIPEQKIVTCFQNTNVQLLVISACLSAKLHPDYPQNGLSQALYQAGIPHVIGMRESVFDKAGIQFAKTLLKNIGERQPVDVALQAARSAIVQPFTDDGYRELDNPARTRASRGQWCLPQLISHDLGHALLDWNFTPRKQNRRDLKSMLGQVIIPESFIGRRRELRQYQNRLRIGELTSLLVTGAGGMGKTALAGKLIDTLRKDGYETFPFSLHPDHQWRDILLDMEMALAEDDTLYKKLEIARKKKLDKAQEAQWFLRLLLERYDGKLALFFDNLESMQETQTPHALTDAALQHWIDAAHSLTRRGLTLILTSRWRLPDWPDAEHYPLGRPMYGDYLAFARRQGLPLEFLRSDDRLQRSYQVLGGNFRALEFFTKAARGMNLEEEKTFLDKLATAEAEIQTNMAQAELVAQRSETELKLLYRLPVYQTGVPLDGIKVLARTAPPVQGKTEELLENLLAVSLLEQYYNQLTGQNEYLLSPLVRGWLMAHGAPEPSPSLLQAAAEFLLWLWEEDINTSWSHLMATHQALLAAGLMEQDQRLVLDWIVGPLNRAGLYQELLDKWLLPLANIENPQIQGEALGQIGKQYFHLADYDTALEYLKQSLAIQQEIGDKSGEGTTLNNMATTAHARGDYDTALEYLKQSLAIRQEIGDKSGLCATLFSIGHIHLQNKEETEAMQAWVKVYGIAQKINLAQALEALENLAESLGLSGGLKGWEMLAQQMEEQDSKNRDYH